MPNRFITANNLFIITIFICRYITSFTCGEPFVDAVTDSEWVLLSIDGQSFLLNQIRKMIGLACEVVTGKVMYMCI
jgi:tRNA pseudouridine(38-40) synthase